jgi:phosphate starvation-inducible membrane PsiE
MLDICGLIASASNLWYAYYTTVLPLAVVYVGLTSIIRVLLYEPKNVHRVAFFAVQISIFLIVYALALPSTVCP